MIYAFFTSKGYSMSRETFATALAKVEVNPGFPADLTPGLQKDAEVLLRRRRSPPFPTGRRPCGPICGPGRPAVRRIPRLSFLLQQ